jgi:hypothetical protein
MLKQTQLREPMNYLGLESADGKELDSRVSALEAVDGKLLDDRVDSLEAATSNIQTPVGAGQTRFVGGVSASSMIAPNLLGPMLTFSGHPPNDSSPQYLNMSGTINNTFRSSLYEGADDAYPFHNFFVAPYNGSISHLSWARISWGPDIPLTDSYHILQFEVDGVLIGSQCVPHYARDYQALVGVVFSMGQTVALRFVNPYNPGFRGLGRVLMFAHVVPTSSHSTI